MRMSTRRFLSLAILRLGAHLTRLAVKTGGAAWLEGIPEAIKPDSAANLAALQTASLRLFQCRTAEVPGMLSAAECDALVYAGMLAPGPGDIVEIGSWLGRSTIHLAHACMASGRGRVHALDTFQGNAGYERLYHRKLGRQATIFEAFQANVASAGLSEWVVPHVGKAEETRADFREPVRLVFIDGSHDYAPVKRDIRLWKELLIPGGLLLLHDFRPEAPGSIAAICEEVFGSGEFRVLMLVDSLIIAQKRIATAG